MLHGSRHLFPSCWNERRLNAEQQTAKQPVVVSAPLPSLPKTDFAPSRIFFNFLLFPRANLGIDQSQAGFLAVLSALIPNRVYLHHSVPEVHIAYDNIMFAVFVYLKKKNHTHTLQSPTYTALPQLPSLADTPTFRARTRSQQVSGARTPF